MAEIVVFGVVAADVILRVQRIPAPGDHVNAEALGWRIGGSSANVACGLSTAGHHVRLVGPIGTDAMGDNLLAELERHGVDTEYSFRADAASPRTLILLDDTGERTIIAVDSGAGPSSFQPVRGPDLRSVDCVYIEGYTRYPTDTAAAARSALLVTSPPYLGQQHGLRPSWSGQRRNTTMSPRQGCLRPCAPYRVSGSSGWWSLEGGRVPMRTLPPANCMLMPSQPNRSTPQVPVMPLPSACCTGSYKGMT
jgi:pfkB family carbohydrate kinase